LIELRNFFFRVTTSLQVCSLKKSTNVFDRESDGLVYDP